MGERRVLQLCCGLRDALWDLGELQVGALNHAGFTAALRGADHIAVALAVQLVILRPCMPARAAWAPVSRGMGAEPALPSSYPPTPSVGLHLFPSSPNPNHCAHITPLCAQSSLSAGYLLWVHGVLRCPPPSPLLQPQPDPRDASVPIRITARWEMPQHVLVPSASVTAAPRNSETRNDGKCSVVLLGQTTGLWHNHPRRQPGQTVTRHTCMWLLLLPGMKYCSLAAEKKAHQHSEHTDTRLGQG